MTTLLMPSDDPPEFDDEPLTVLHVTGNWDYAIAVGPNDGQHPLHWVTLRTSGGHDDFAVHVVAALFHHLAGREEQAKRCAEAASRCSDTQLQRAVEVRKQRLEDPRFSKRSSFDNRVFREHGSGISRETWDALGRQHGWLEDNRHRIVGDHCERCGATKEHASAFGRCDNDGCEGQGRCHGAMKWCSSCGDVSSACDQVECDVHTRGLAKYDGGDRGE